MRKPFVGDIMGGNGLRMWQAELPAW